MGLPHGEVAPSVALLAFIGGFVDQLLRELLASAVRVKRGDSVGFGRGRSGWSVRVGGSSGAPRRTRSGPWMAPSPLSVRGWKGRLCLSGTPNSGIHQKGFSVRQKNACTGFMQTLRTPGVFHLDASCFSVMTGVSQNPPGERNGTGGPKSHGLGPDVE